MQMFDYLTQHPEEMEIFVDAMRSFTVETGAAMSIAYDFSSMCACFLLTAAVMVSMRECILASLFW
jgi:hypothetical protein